MPCHAPSGKQMPWRTASGRTVPWRSASELSRLRLKRPERLVRPDAKDAIIFFPDAIPYLIIWGSDTMDIGIFLVVELDTINFCHEFQTMPSLLNALFDLPLCRVMGQKDRISSEGHCRGLQTKGIQLSFSKLGYSIRTQQSVTIQPNRLAGNSRTTTNIVLLQCSFVRSDHLSVDGKW